MRKWRGRNTANSAVCLQGQIGHIAGPGVVKSLSLQKMMALLVLCVETFADRVDLGRGNKMITITSSDDDYVIIIR